MIPETKLPQFLPNIKQLVNTEKQSLLTKSFLLEIERDLAMYYAPHNEYINTEAKIIIVGITPGWNQMKIAYNQLIKSIEEGESIEKILKKTKIAASFSGIMRKNLTTMLDIIGLADILNIDSTAQLFTIYRTFLHTTSVIKYPVFYKDKNYTGHTPTIEQSDLLKQYAYEISPNELAQITSPALVIPLGKTTENVIQNIQIKNDLHTYLFGFPHPSGANGHREKQFQQNKQLLRKKIEEWAQNT